MDKSYRLIGLVIVVIITIAFALCISCSKSYLQISDEDFTVSNIPPNWSIATKDQIDKAQEIEEKNLGYNPDRVKANVLLSAGLDRGDGDWTAPL